MVLLFGILIVGAGEVARRSIRPEVDPPIVSAYENRIVESEGLILDLTPSDCRTLALAARGDLSCMAVVPSTVGPSAESITVFGPPTEYPRVDLSLPAHDRPFAVALPQEPTPEECAALRKADAEMLDELSEEQRRGLLGSWATLRSPSSMIRTRPSAMMRATLLTG